MFIADDLTMILLELVQLRKDWELRQAREAVQSHDLMTREEALKVIYFKWDNAANFAIQMDPAKTIIQHLRAITTTDESKSQKEIAENFKRLAP